MNILLTGGTGYIGSHTAVTMLEQGHNVVLFDNLCNSKAEVADILETITGKTIPFVVGDVRDTALLTSTMKSYQIDAVIHFAGLKAVGESSQKPVEYYANNVQGTISLLEAMTAVGIKSLIFSSSATVYGSPKYLPIDESHPLSATNPYGRSKLQIEEILADLAKSDEDWHIVCLRYFNPVGAHASGLIGEKPNGIPNNLLPYVAKVATGEFAQLHVYGSDYDTFDGSGVRDFIHVMDLASGHSAALDFMFSSPGWNAINLGTGKGYSVFEMIQAFEKACNCPIPYVVIDRREGDIAACYANVDKAAKELKWTAQFDLDEMCQTVWKFECNKK